MMPILSNDVVNSAADLIMHEQGILVSCADIDMVRRITQDHFLPCDGRKVFFDKIGASNAVLRYVNSSIIFRSKGPK